MLLEDVPIARLARMLEPHMDQPAWPGIARPADRARVKRWMKKLGRWGRLGESLEDPGPPPRVLWSRYQQFKRSGTRKGDEADRRQVGQRVNDLTLGLWLGHPAADVDAMHDLLWAICEMTTWVPSAHQYCNLDLLSTEWARMLAQSVWLVGDQLDQAVTDRLHAEIRRRVLDVASDWRTPDWWSTVPMNWNHVCNANLVITALYEIDGFALPNFIHPRIQNMQYALDGFGDDGSCLEGPGYWGYGFGHFINAAIALRHRTGGALNLADDPKVGHICRFPIATHIAGDHRAIFGDNSHGRVANDLAIKINYLLDVPELLAIARPDDEGRVAPRSLEALAIYRGQKARTERADDDALLPDLGLAKLRQGKASKRTTLVALAGRNDFPHNHNDVGSFMVHKHGRCLLTDPGAPVYTARTFGSERYTILQTRSFGHSVPLINGREQPEGSEYHATLEAEGVDDDKARVKRATIEMASAYDVADLKQLQRAFELAADGTLTMTDSYRFGRKPRSVEEAFVTYEPAKVAGGGRSVTIGSGRRSMTLRAESPGRFKVNELSEAESAGRDNPGTLKRITFTPTKLERQMQLRFVIS